ncbi:MAG TPA: FAD-dependent oxidoreductase [Allosphingosinicella sp.]|nr:FAD-dependent oxidoreductase [Allosphingosinicella sp.]
MTRRTATRAALALLAAALVAAFFLFDLRQYLSLEGLRARHADLAALLVTRPLLVVSLFFLVYVAAIALSIPGATILTLGAGAIFGLWLGVLIVSFASTLGGTLAFLGSRYLFRDWVERRFGERMQAIDRGLERDGIFYLLALRLNPAVPFFFINLAMGLTRMGMLRFALVSQIGMLPATFVYVNAGTQLAQIRTLSDIATPGLIGSLILLSLFPLIAKAAVGALKRRRVYRGWKRPKRFDRNLIVIGAGAGGLVTAYIAAAVRAKVTLIEAKEMGGDCLNTGCVPSKALIRSARAAHEMRTSTRYGLACAEPQVDFPAVMRRVRDIIKHIAPADSVERYTSLGVDVRQGYATLVDPWTVEVNGERLTARSIVIAAGGEPVLPPIPGLADSGYLTSDTMWEALERRETLPKRLVIVGGGPIGVEMAQAFTRLGSAVTLVQGGKRILPKEDDDAAAVIARRLADEGVALLTGHQALRVEQKALIAGAEGREIHLPYDELLVAVGRKPRLSGYGLEALGIDAEAPPETNGFLETRFPNIYLVGDVAGSLQFTHFAAHQAWFAAVNALFGSVRRFRADYRVLPWVTFTDPEVAHVGHNEQSAREAGIDYELVRYDLSHLDRAVTESANSGFVKLLVQPGKDRILGATIVATGAGELIAEPVLAMKHGIGLNKILGTIHAYPTLAEANKYAAGEWKKAHKPERLLAWAERWHRWRRG